MELMDSLLLFLRKKVDIYQLFIFIRLIITNGGYHGSINQWNQLNKGSFYVI